MFEGVDYAWARPGGAALTAAGKTFAGRYLLAGGGKGLTAGEVVDLHTHSVAVFVIFETSATEALNGFAAGAADARAAVAQLAACGLPALPVYFATDWDVLLAQDGAVDQYLAGAASVIGVARNGLYGGEQIIRHCQASGSASWFFQTYAWSGTPTVWLPGVHIQQYRNGQNINGSVDFCRAMTADFGQTATGFSSLISTIIPTPAPILKAGKDMLLVRTLDSGTITYPGGSIVCAGGEIITIPEGGHPHHVASAQEYSTVATQLVPTYNGHVVRSQDFVTTWPTNPADVTGFSVTAIQSLVNVYCS